MRGMALFDLLLRAWAACLGAFTLSNLLMAGLDGGLDPNLWWIDLRWAPGFVRFWVMLSAGCALIATGLYPRWAPRWFTRPIFGALFVVSCANGISVMAIYFEGRARGGGVPLSFFTAFFFFLLVESTRRLANESTLGRRRRLLALTAGVFSFGIAFPLCLAWTFGNTIYLGDLQPTERGHATVVVLGAGVGADGTPSLALFDRARTAIDLYKDGVVDKLFLSGGPGPGGQHEVDAMLRMALDEGVPREACELDREGLSTAATAAHGAEFLLAEGAPVYAVSHSYHLPRVELAFWRHGLDVRTVPAKETRPLARRTYYLMREVPGFWAYWARRGFDAV